jgi:hypothetical protein
MVARIQATLPSSIEHLALDAGMKRLTTMETSMLRMPVVHVHFIDQTIDQGLVEPRLTEAST